MIKRTSRGAVTLSIKSAIKNESMSNKELAEELHKSIIRKFEKTKVYSCLVDNIWDADIADMQLISKFSKGIRFLLIFSANSHGLFLWKIKRYYNCQCFPKNYKSNHKPNKIWTDKGSEFYNRSMKSWLEKNAIEMFSTHN